LLDEPTAHLDPPHQVALVRLLQTLAQQGHTLVSVLHDLSLALQADHLVVMAEGRVIAQGPPGDAAMHAALCAVFGGALRIAQVDGQWLALPCLPVRL
jgi:iron complex transport system ATP-binding protein